MTKPHRLLSVLTAPVFAALLLAAPAAAQAPAASPDSAQARTAARDAATLKQFPPPGRMVDVGGRRLHIYCEGPPRGPTVILETGAMASSLYYRAAQDEVARVARVCAYDRAGLGWSDPANYPRSLEARADDLHTLLAKAKIKGPYILAGHSMGGLLARVYARKYPRDLAGLVLIEPSEEHFNGAPDVVARTKANAQALGGAVQAAAMGADIPFLRVPNGPTNQAVALRASVYRAGQDDMAAMGGIPEEMARLGGLGRVGDTPLVVVTRGKRDPGMTDAQTAAWQAAHARLAGLSTRSLQLTAGNSGHGVHADQPEMFAEAVRQVLAMRK